MIWATVSSRSCVGRETAKGEEGALKFICGQSTYDAVVIRPQSMASPTLFPGYRPRSEIAVSYDSSSFWGTFIIFSIMTWPTDILISDVIRVPFPLYPHQHLLPPTENGQWRDEERLMQLDPFVMATGKTTLLPDLSDLEKICSWYSTSSVNATF